MVAVAAAQNVGAAAADKNARAAGDGDPDALSAAYTGHEHAWYENGDSQSFTKEVLSSSYTNAQGISAADVDSDSDLDVLATAETGNKVGWFENDCTGCPTAAPTLSPSVSLAPTTAAPTPSPSRPPTSRARVEITRCVPNGSTRIGNREIIFWHYVV